MSGIRGAGKLGRLMNKKTGKVEIPEEGQPLGKDFPPEARTIEPDGRGNLVAGSNSYEVTTGAEAEKGTGPSGPFDVPDDDLSGEGWTPPMQPGGGWVHPVEKSLEEHLDSTEGPTVEETK